MIRKALIIVLCLYSLIVIAETLPSSKKPESNSTEPRKKNVSGWNISLMIRPQDKELLQSSISSLQEFRKNLTLKNDENSAGNFIAAKHQALKYISPKISPSFYLSTIIYNDNGSWTIWLRHKKFSSDDDKNIHSQDEFTPKIIKTSIEKIDFSWETNFINEISPNWESKLKSSDSNIYYNDDKAIIVIKNQNLIKFSLKPNQTFVVHNMEISEGEVKDVILKTDNNNNIPGINDELMKKLNQLAK